MKKLKDKDREIIDGMMGRIVKEIGIEKFNELVRATYKDIHGEEPIAVRVGNCPYAPYCGTACHVFGFNCEHKPCVT